MTYRELYTLLFTSQALIGRRIGSARLDELGKKIFEIEREGGEEDRSFANRLAKGPIGFAFYKLVRCNNHHSVWYGALTAIEIHKLCEVLGIDQEETKQEAALLLFHKMQRMKSEWELGGRKIDVLEKA